MIDLLHAAAVFAITAIRGFVPEASDNEAQIFQGDLKQDEIFTNDDSGRRAVYRQRELCANVLPKAGPDLP